MMKVSITQARVHVTGQFSREGSALAQTIQTQCDGIQISLEVESPEERERVAGVLRNAEHGCYVMQSLMNPVPVQTAITLNGEAMEPPS